MISAMTPLPVLGVPVKSRALNGLDSLLSIVQMPAGVPTATFAVGESGATNAALFAVRMLALNDKELATKLDQFIQKKAKQALEGNAIVQTRVKSGDN
jgi:5-(carboxyamino)imidazole ribonucleotide mutase